MKKSFLLCLMTISFVQAADTTTAGFVNGDVQVNDALTKMMAVEGVKPLYDKCITEKLPDLAKCLWDKIQEQGNSTIKEKVLAASKEAAKSDPSGSAIKEKFSTDPAMQKLGEVISAKLKDALFGAEATRDKDNLKAVDQKSFNDIYRAELNKTMVDAFMSYCLDTVGAPTVTNEAGLKANREHNIDQLNGKDPTVTPKEFLSPSKGDNPWTKCIAGIKTDCTVSSSLATDKSRRACIVTQYVDSARKNLTVLTETDNVYKNMASGSRNVLPSDLKSLGALTTVTSKDIETAYKDTTEEAKKKMAECIQTKSEQTCKQFLNTETKANEAAVIEFSLQQNADAENFGQNVDKIKTDDEMKTFLKSQGYSEEKLKTMVFNEQTIIQIKTDIKDRYKKEKESLIKEMNDRVTKKTADANGKIDTTQASSDQGKLGIIRDELDKRTDNMANLFKFSNIVSGYLTVSVTSNGKKTNQNTDTTAMVTELNSNDANKSLKTAIEAGGVKMEVTPTDSNTETRSTLNTDAVLLKAMEDKAPPTP